MAQTAIERTDQDGRERIEARVTPAQKAILEQAATKRGLPLGDFISESLERLAGATVDEDNVIVLRSEDSAIFADVLLNPPEPGPVLRAAARRHGFIQGNQTRDGERTL